MTLRETTPTSSGSGTPAGGWVSFVGAGPGDPRLLTLRAVELLRDAAIVITEHPDHEVMVREVLADLERLPDFVDGGASADGAVLADTQRATMVAQQARRGRVVRLISGDPFAFASGPFEAQACARAGIGFEIVPGVSAMAAIPAYAGIPITGPGQGEVVVVTRADGIAWERHASTPSLVVMDSGAALPQIARSLMAAGRAPETPVAITSGGSTWRQQTVVSTLGTAVADVRAAKLSGEWVTVIGDVVHLRDQLSWFETKPLFGWRVLVPRTKDSSAAALHDLREHGAVPEEVPTISVELPRTPQQMDKAIRGLVEGRYEWVAFTSAHSVRAVREKLESYGLDARALSGVKLAVVDDRTAAAVSEWGLRPDLVPTEQTAAGLVAVWPEFDADFDPINRVFLPRADLATESLVAGLHELGWECDDVTAYRTVRASPPPAPVREAIKSGQFDAVVFTSSSTVRNLLGIAGKPHVSTVIAAIGPQTAQTARDLGLRVDVIASTPTPEALVDALADFGVSRREELLASGQHVTRPSQRRARRRS